MPRKRSSPAPPKAVREQRTAEARQADQFRKASKLFQGGKYSRARRILEKVQEGPDAGLSHRARVYLEICRKKEATKRRPPLRTLEDYYNYSVQLVNDRKLGEAQRVLRKGLALYDDAPHLHYLRAVALVLAGQRRDAYPELKRAIELDPGIRVLARRDPDIRAAMRSEPFAGLIADR